MLVSLQGLALTSESATEQRAREGERDSQSEIDQYPWRRADSSCFLHDTHTHTYIYISTYTYLCICMYLCICICIHIDRYMDGWIDR